MTEKRFIESATQNVDDGKINHYIYDMLDREYLKMSDENTTKNLCDLLNDLHERNKQIKHLIDEAIRNERTELGRSVLRQLKEAIE